MFLSKSQISEFRVHTVFLGRTLSFVYRPFEALLLVCKCMCEADCIFTNDSLSDMYIKSSNRSRILCCAATPSLISTPESVEIWSVNLVVIFTVTQISKGLIIWDCFSNQPCDTAHVMSQSI